MNVIYPVETDKWGGWINGEYRLTEAELLLEDAVVESERTVKSIEKFAKEHGLIPEGANAMWIHPEHEVLKTPDNYPDALATLRMRVNFYRI